MKQEIRSISQQVIFEAKRLFFPGLDLHTRFRYKKLPEMFRRGDIKTLDAGCGNGCLGFAASRLGNKVLGVSIDDQSIVKNREFYRWIRCAGLEFEVCNLYDLKKLGRKFDQIICSETLEHVERDSEVIQTFAEILTDGGILHLCCPYPLHPHHKLGRTNDPETGGHVRDGYTLGSYRTLLEPAGFTIVRHLGLGSNFLFRADQIIRWIRNGLGDIGALPSFVLFGWVVILLDGFVEPKTPFSLYVQAIKRT